MSGPASPLCSSDLPEAYVRLCRLAERGPRHAVRLARAWQRANTDPEQQAFLEFTLGYTLLLWERLDEAEAALTRASDYLQQSKMNLLALDIKRALLFVALLRGRNSSTIADWAALATTYNHIGYPLLAARTSFGQMIQLNLQGQLQQSLALGRQIQATLESLGSPGDQAWLKRIMGVALTALGEYEQANLLLRQALVLFTEECNRTEQAKTRFECSYYSYITGNFSEALSELEDTYRVVKKLDLPLRIAFCEKNLGLFTARVGEFDRGIYFSLQAYDKLALLNRPDYMAGCDMNLGIIAYDAGLWSLAMAAYQRAERIYVDLDYQSMQQIARRNQALVLCEQKQSAKALELLEKLIQQAEQMGKQQDLANLVQITGKALADIGHIQLAAQAYERAEMLWLGLKSMSSAGESRAERGLLFLGQGLIEQAEDLLQTARPLLTERLVYHWRVEYGLGRCAEASGNKQQALEYYQQACYTIARLRQHLANEHASSGIYKQAQQLIEATFHLAWELQNAELVLEISELQRSLGLISAIRQTQTKLPLEKSTLNLSQRQSSLIADHYDPLGEEFKTALQSQIEERLRNRQLRPLEVKPEPIELQLPILRARLQQAFPTGWQLVNYIPCQDKLLIIILDQEQIELHTTPLDDHLKYLISKVSNGKYRWHTFVQEAETTAQHSVPWATLEELSTRLLPISLKQGLHPDKRLLIISSGQLHGLPWGALRVKGRWLAQEAVLQMLPSLHIWQELIRHYPAGNTALAIAMSNFGARARQLVGTQATLDIVEQSWAGSVDRLEGEGATIATLFRLAQQGTLEQYSLIHVATHGKLIEANGLLAHLKLADGDLRYHDIMQLKLGGALVVLASCEGATAEVLPGEEILSLSMAFLGAGARDIIASEWQLYDKIAPLLFELFYTKLKLGYDPPMALALAQRTWLVEKALIPEIADLKDMPYVWASLSVVGAGTWLRT